MSEMITKKYKLEEKTCHEAASYNLSQTATLTLLNSGKSKWQCLKHLFLCIAEEIDNSWNTCLKVPLSWCIKIRIWKYNGHFLNHKVWRKLVHILYNLAPWSLSITFCFFSHTPPISFSSHSHPILSYSLSSWCSLPMSPVHLIPTCACGV